MSEMNLPEGMTTEEFEKKELQYATKPATDRYEICKSCEHLRGPARQCKLCWCVMPLKVLMPAATCPAGKW